VPLILLLCDSKLIVILLSVVMTSTIILVVVMLTAFIQNAFTLCVILLGLMHSTECHQAECHGSQPSRKSSDQIDCNKNEQGTINSRDTIYKLICLISVNRPVNFLWKKLKLKID
jgi:hypothetical protein